MEKILTTERIASDPDGRSFLDHVDTEAPNAGIADAIVYYDFPTYADYDAEAHRPDFLLLTHSHGVIAVKFAARHLPMHEAQTHAGNLDRTLSSFCSILIGRLLKSRLLRSGRSTLRFEVTPIIVWLGFSGSDPNDLESEFANSFEALFRLIADLGEHPISEQEFSEARSIIEGAKALTRPQRRVIEDPARERKAAALAALESEIANFDERQRQTALSTVQGPQRIRGLAGSGKTVILAMKAAHLHMANPGANILVTFHTRSLQFTLEVLITRFYRHYKDEDPDWTRIHVRHGWGETRRAGVYSEACGRHGVPPLALSEARRASPDPFDYACRDLLCRVTVTPYYDFVLIDEGQDFPSGFYELVFALASNDRDRKNIIWAYDELQNILNVKLRSPHELFGTDEDGRPRIDLERAAAHLPQGVQNDIVLSKCYRNQREVLVVAHALGFGMYGNIVQLLQDGEHWNDVGYEVHSGPLIIGQPVRIFRPAENSPVSLAQDDGNNIVECTVFDEVKKEVEWIVSGIRSFIDQGLRPEDILVISLDDRNARAYFHGISGRLSGMGA